MPYQGAVTKRLPPNLSMDGTYPRREAVVELFEKDLQARVAAVEMHLDGGPRVHRGVDIGRQVWTHPVQRSHATHPFCNREAHDGVIATRAVEGGRWYLQTRHGWYRMGGSSCRHQHDDLYSQELVGVAPLLLITSLPLLLCPAFAPVLPLELSASERLERLADGCSGMSTVDR